MKNVTIIDESSITRNSNLKIYMEMLRKREVDARQFLNENPDAQHVLYGYRYTNGDEMDCYLSRLILTDTELDEYNERASKIGAILYVLHQR